MKNTINIKYIFKLRRVFTVVILLLVGINVSAQNRAEKMSQVAIDKYEQARENPKALRALVENNKGKRLGAAAQNRLGYLAYKEGNLENAEAEYLRTYQEFNNVPEIASARLHLGKINYKKGDYQNARKYFAELAASRQPDRAEWGRYYLARSMRALNDPGTERAIQAYFSNSRDETADKDVIMQNELERYYSQNQQFDKAVQAAQNLVERYPDSKYAPMNEAKIVDLYIVMGQTEQAIAQCRKIIAKYGAQGHNAARAQNSLAGTYAGRGDFEKARTEYKKLIMEYPLEQRWVNAAAYGEAVTDMRQGYIEQDTALVNRSLEKFWELQEKHPDDRHVPRAMMSAAQISMGKNLFEEALKATQIIIDYNPDFIDVVKPGGHSNDLEGHRQLVRQAHLTKAKLLRGKLDRPEEALVEYEILLTKDQNDAEALYGKALTLKNLERIEESRNVLMKLIKANSEYEGVANSLLESLDQLSQ